MQSVPTAFGGFIDLSANQPDSSSSSSAQPATPVLRAATPQQSLLHSARNGDIATAKALLANGGIDVNAIDPATQLTPLMLAAMQGHEDVALALIRAKPGAEVNQRNNRGDSALLLAASGGKTEVVEQLLDRKADIEQCNLKGCSALVEAAAGARLETAALLLERGARVDGAEGGKVPLVVAARLGDGAMVELLLEKKASMQMRDSDGWTAFNYAASRGHDALAQRLRVEEDPAKSVATIGAQDKIAATVTTTTALTTTTTLTTTTSTTSVITTQPGYAPLASGRALTANTTANDAEVQRLAQQIMEESLRPEEEPNEDSIKALAALLVNPQCKVKKLDFGCKKVGATDAASLWEALKENRTLTGLYLVSSRIGAAGAALLSEALKVNRTLTELNVNCNRIGAAGAASLSAVLKVNGTLTTLRLDGNKIGAAGATALSKALEVNCTLTSLDLRGNNIRAASLTELSAALKGNRTLTALRLDINKIDAAGATELSGALKVNRTLTTLHLAFNKIGAAGATALSEMLAVNGTLTALDLQSNQLGDDGATALSNALKVNRTLTMLEVSLGNEISAQALAAIKLALESNRTRKLTV